VAPCIWLVDTAQDMPASLSIYIHFPRIHVPDINCQWGRPIVLSVCFLKVHTFSSSANWSSDTHSRNASASRTTTPKPVVSACARWTHGEHVIEASLLSTGVYTDPACKAYPVQALPHSALGGSTRRRSVDAAASQRRSRRKELHLLLCGFPGEAGRFAVLMRGMQRQFVAVECSAKQSHKPSILCNHREGCALWW
jgi:hypothetical protein